MTPSPNRQAVIMGLFVATATAILAGAVLMVGDLNDTFTRKIAVHAVFDDVGGLQAGDNIWFSGVKVGTVKALVFRAAAEVEVTLKIDAGASAFIHRDVQAKLGSDGLIGSKIVVIFGGSDTAPPIVEGDVIQTATAISTEQIMTTLQANNENLLAITTDIRGVTEKLAAGEGTIGKLLGDETLYTQAAATVATLGDASDSAKQVTASLAVFSAKLNRPGSLPHDLVTDTTTYAELTQAVGKLHQASASAATLADGLAAGAADPNSAAGTLLHDPGAGADVKAVLSNLSAGTVLLNDDLEAAQHNFLLRGFFKKRSKRAAAEQAEGDAP